MNNVPMQHDTAVSARHNGHAMAAILAGGIGAFAMGLVVIVSELGVSIPALYAPAGGVSSRTALAAVIWLVSWAILHSRWKDNNVEPRRVHTWTLLLAALGVLFTFPPFWGLL